MSYHFYRIPPLAKYSNSANLRLMIKPRIHNIVTAMINVHKWDLYLYFRFVTFVPSKTVTRYLKDSCLRVQYVIHCSRTCSQFRMIHSCLLFIWFPIVGTISRVCKYWFSMQLRLLRFCYVVLFSVSSGELILSVNCCTLRST